MPTTTSVRTTCLQRWQFPHIKHFLALPELKALHVVSFFFKLKEYFPNLSGKLIFVPNLKQLEIFSNFSCMFLNPNIFFFNLNSNWSNLLYLWNLQEQVKKAFCYQKLFWPFTVRTNCSSDLKFFPNSRPSGSNFKKFSWSQEQFFLTVGQNNFGNKIPWLLFFLYVNMSNLNVNPSKSSTIWLHNNEFIKWYCK